MILVVDNYDSFTYNLVQLLSSLGADVRVERNDALTAADALELEPAGIVISPGPGTPDDAGISRELIRGAAEAGIPVLGVCLGHQCIAEVFGAAIVRGQEPVHGKTAQVSHSGSGVLTGVASPFTATRYHSLTVDPDSLTDELGITASTDDGVIMGLAHRDLPVFGVQFHPESVLTPEGVRIVENFLALCGEGSGKDLRRLSSAQTRTSSPQHTAPGEASLDAPDGLSAQDALKRVLAGESLTEDEAAAAMGAIMDGDTTDAQIASLVTALRMKGESVDEITGFARAMREHATPVRPLVADFIDTCGTGGDGLDSFNISTVTAFVVAGAGVPIAKHGNRSVSSACGSADVLEALGVRIDLSPEDMAHCIDEVGVGFLFAQALHPSMRHAGGPRKEMGVRTVFNVLGPLTNPAGARRQLLGVYDRELVPVMAEVAGRLGADHVLVVHGAPGMDEVSVSGPTFAAEFRDGVLRTFEIDPEELGLPLAPIEALRGGDAERNAGIARSVLAGDKGPMRDAVLINAAAALVVADVAKDLLDGLVRARQSIDSGAAAARLEALVAVSARLAEAAREPEPVRGGAQ